MITYYCMLKAPPKHPGLMGCEAHMMRQCQSCWQYQHGEHEPHFPMPSTMGEVMHGLCAVYISKAERLSCDALAVFRYVR